MDDDEELEHKLKFWIWVLLFDRYLLLRIAIDENTEVYNARTYEQQTHSKLPTKGVEQSLEVAQPGAIWKLIPTTSSPNSRTWSMSSSSVT